MTSLRAEKIHPCLWFDNQAEEAAEFYTSIFDNARIVDIGRYGEAASDVSSQKEGSVMTVLFEIEGQRFMALNGGPIFNFTEAVSFVINCETQDEVDYFWGKLTDGGSEQPCGWLKDRYGLSWQVVPTEIIELLSSGESEKVERMSQSLFQMKKLDIGALKAAYHGTE